VFDGFTVLEVLLYYLGHVILYDAEVPGAPWVDDEVRAVLAEPEAVHGVDADVPVHALRAQLVLERSADGLGSALLAVTALADQHVGVVVADLRGWLRERRQGSVLLFTFLLTFPGDGFLRFQLAPC
jgi:hypothetical protein